MAFKARPNTFTYYRLFFVTLLFAGGVISLGLAALEYLGGFALFGTESVAERDSILIAISIAGVLCLIYASLMLMIISDRRGKKPDRRQRQMPIDFPDRRSGLDRREVAAQARAQAQAGY